MTRYADPPNRFGLLRRAGGSYETFLMPEAAGVAPGGMGRVPATTRDQVAAYLDNAPLSTSIWMNPTPADMGGVPPTEASMDRMMMCQGARTIGEFLARHPGGRGTVPRAGGGGSCDAGATWTWRKASGRDGSAYPCLHPAFGSATDAGFGVYEAAGNALGPRERAF